MNELPLSSKYRTNAEDPVDDAERADLAARLSEEFTAGRLSQDDYLGQLDVVYRAEMLGELAGIVQRLPPRSTHSVPAVVQQGDRLPGTVGGGKNVVAITIAALAGLLTVAGLIIILLAFLLF